MPTEIARLFFNQLDIVEVIPGSQAVRAMQTLPLVSQPITPRIGEHRVVFHDLDWWRYQTIRQALGQHRAARIVYDQGTLEITIPLEDHEFLFA
jgi:hypothetical protein